MNTRLLSRLRPLLYLTAASSFCVAVHSDTVHADVVINEIHYHPANEAPLEFVELQNAGIEAVALDGWGFTSGIRYVFGPGTELQPGDFLVVCQNREALSEEYGIAIEALYGEYAGGLANGGETIVLEDRDGNIVDEVDFGDESPWPSSADGDGPSLERICATFNGATHGNWSTSSAPTPLRENALVECPPPIPAPTIAINELNYHPFKDNDLLEEFVELINNTSAPINLRGYSFSDGISFTFESDLVLGPGGFVAVARNQEHLRKVSGVENIVGDFTGELSNRGERITLIDAEGGFVDSLAYSDHGDWPIAPDSLGPSLEKIVPTAPSDDPASWTEAGLGDLSVWRHAKIRSFATHRRVVLIYIQGAGEFLIDNLRIIDPDHPDVDFVPNGTFDTDLEGWDLRGEHEATFWEPTGGPDGSGAMHVVSTGPGSGARNRLIAVVVTDLELRGRDYVMSFDYKHLSGATGLVVRLDRSAPGFGLNVSLGDGSVFSPGAENGVLTDEVSPFISLADRFPQEPKSTDETWITTSVRGSTPLAKVELTYSLNEDEEEFTLAMADDGEHRDGVAGDRLFGVALPPQPHHTAVRFRIRAEDVDGRIRVSPLAHDPNGFHGYYVSDSQVDSRLPTYTLIRFVGFSDFRAAVTSLPCDDRYLHGAFAYRGDLYWNVGLRKRGQSVCSSATKPYLKIKFQRGRDFQNQHKLNLQSLWTDKSLVREKFSWEVFRDIGSPACRHEYVRLHVNGEYFGLYAELEHPDDRFLARNRLNPDGNLYKAVNSVEQPHGVYSDAYEKKTNEDGDFSDLKTFIETMHATPAGELQSFFEVNVDEDRTVEYLLGQSLTNNSDFPHKNHYLYHDTERGKWIPIVWDVDLTFGKVYSGSVGGVYHDGMHTPGNDPYFLNGGGPGTGNQFLDRFFGLTGDYYRRAYMVRLFDSLQEKYTEEFYDVMTLLRRDLLWNEQAVDIAAWGRTAPAGDPTAPAEFLPNIERVLEHVRQRRPHLLGRVSEWQGFVDHPRLKITEVMYNPAIQEAAEFLELWNPGSETVDVTGWSVEGIGFSFPDGGTVAPGEFVVVARDPEIFRSSYEHDGEVFGPYDGRLDNNGEVLRVKDAGPGYPATVDYLRYSDRDGWPHEADGFGHSLELTRISPHRDNDLPDYWQVSDDIGGSPGVMTAVSPETIVYRRGDPNSDGATNVSDAISILLFLVGGRGDLGCEAAADVNADARIDLADATYLLDYLFADVVRRIPTPGPGECLPAESACATSNCWVLR